MWKKVRIKLTEHKKRERDNEGERDKRSRQTDDASVARVSAFHLFIIHISILLRSQSKTEQQQQKTIKMENGHRSAASEIEENEIGNELARWKSLLNRERERTSECTQSLLYGWWKWKGKIFSTPCRAQERVYNIKTATYSASASLIPFTMSILVSTAVVSKLSAGKMVIHGRHYKLQRPPQRYYLHWCGK